MKFRQTRSLGMRRIQFAAERSVMEALTGGNVDEREVELRAEFRQVVTNIYVELRRGLVSLGYRFKNAWLSAYLSSACGILRI